MATALVEIAKILHITVTMLGWFGFVIFFKSIIFFNNSDKKKTHIFFFLQWSHQNTENTYVYSKLVSLRISMYIYPLSAPLSKIFIIYEAGKCFLVSALLFS